MAELNKKTDDAAVAENPVIARWQKDAFAGDAGNAPFAGRKLRILGGVQLSGSGNYCALMDLMQQSAPALKVC